MLLSSAATHSIEEVAETNAPRWFQLYWVNDREICESFVRRAEAAGYGAIVVTLDTLTLGWRPRDLRQAYLPFIKGEGCGQYFTDPVFLSQARQDAGRGHAHRRGDDALDVPEPRPDVGRPRLAARADDAADPRQGRAHRRRRGSSRCEHGVDGVVVSNHGGRQVDGAVAALDALVEVRDALPDAVVLMDGGIRCAADVLKAMALGADAVLLGRPYAYALAVGGQRGVEELIQNLMAEIDLNLALAGAHSIRELDRIVADQRRSPRRAAARSRSRRSRSTRPGPGEVLVRIEATGVCHSDLHVIEEDGWGHALPGAARPRGRGHDRGGRRGRRRARAGRSRRPRLEDRLRRVRDVPARRAAAVQAAARRAAAGCTATTAPS